ncbi:MAG: hypothetical protein ACYDHN_14190 [Solirubrobacteraceae bacterium]
MVVPTLSGCAAEGPPGSAAAQAGVIGEVVEQLKEEDDQAESEELAPLREARQEEREQAQDQELE